jgi:epoxyqueuosine reductase
MISSSELTQSIREEADRLGFHLVGITTPDPPPHLDAFEQWLDEGRHGQMEWMASNRARQRRANPRLILSECQSIVVLGIRHDTPSSDSTEMSKENGKVASYAWGEDYHDVIPDRLAKIVSFIEGKLGHSIPNRCYTDTGPILEREIAQRAGLGWIGKNTNLINPKIGSYFLLAEILLGIELIPDTPFPKDQCGSCTRCIEACPTDCILPNRTIDANRCISYLTIEHRGIIPVELRQKIDDWIFGCDICQEVCPWNQRFSPPQGDSAFQPRFGLARPTLMDELALSPEAFNRKFKGNPVKRTKRRGYLRNVAIAFGNSPQRDAIQILAKALSDPEPLVRGHAAWALGQIGGDEAMLALKTALQTEGDEQVRAEIQQSLTTSKDTELTA